MLRFRDPAPGSSELLYVRAALENDGLVMLPTDTVYGLAALAMSQTACAALYAAKGRDLDQPTAVLFASLADVHVTLPSLTPRAWAACQVLLPGPFTLLVADPEHSFHWLEGTTPGVIGIRVPADAEPLPAIAATSANLPGEPEVELVDQLPAELAAQIACAIDRGPRPPGFASTILDLTAWEQGSVTAPDAIRIIRDPAARAAAALERLASL